MTKIEPSNDTAVLTCHNLSYEVQTRTCFKKSQKILRDISGIYRPGLNAIMGPSGGGKTSLMDILAQRKDVKAREMTGHVLLNGDPLPSNYNLMAGYVVQDDVVTGTLTVRENLMFAADLRLRRWTSQEERRNLVSSLLNDLALKACADTKVGTELIKGVSGGERKRCNIGMELVTKPKILFLDEPTTGLDASTSVYVIKILRRLATNGNRTIIFSIHQPRFVIYKQTDYLHLLSSFGQTVYHGAAAEAVKYFNSIGLPCETFNNPPDFFMDIILKHKSVKQIGNDDVSAIHQDVDVEKTAPPSDEFLNIAEADKKDLPRLFRESDQNQKLLQDCTTIFDNGNPSKKPGQTNMAFGSNWFHQLSDLSKRSILNYVRNPVMSAIEVSQSIFLALLVGAILWQVNDDESGFFNKFGICFFMVAQMMWSNLANVDLFIKDRVLFMHEMANGFYQPSSFFVSKLTAELLPMRLVPTVIFITIFYWMVGFQKDVEKFFFTLFVTLLINLAGCGFVFLMGILVGNYAVASAFVTLLFILNMIFSGLMMSVKDMEPWIRWANDLSIARYALSAVGGIQLKDLDFCGERTLSLDGGVYRTEFTCESGKSQLDRQGINYETKDQWMYAGLLLVFIVVLFGLSYIRVLTLRKTR